ncbi:GNAT family N-acetyltransferase [Winogradskyella sp. UBA3174]|uniref:GNAT family N-acetyltransferase n=1 Tax=Winogradskyella sp. UBA3174 TaxID=1947785 RepID=UPI0025E1DE9D|nr:GNAT family N-acetyltransferase [Winogradskyella sp. UBA3174]|tara:strand:- start:9527 stop:10069 length:543 start_codon:yes stop_codon:yes gene_type:complete
MISITDKIQLQDIKIEDQSKLMTLLESIYPPAYEYLWKNKDCSFYLNKFYSLENLELELADPNATYYFVTYNSDLAGIFRIIYNKSFEEFQKKKATYINRIYLAKTAQGKGVAQHLFNWVEQEAKEKGNTLLWLKAMDSKKQALRFYEKQSYNYASPTHLDFPLMHTNLRGMQIMYKLLT